MKKINTNLFLIIVMIFVFSKTLAQEKGFYLTINSGYSSGLNKTENVNDETTISATEILQESKNFSYGSGINFGGTIGYQMNNRLGFEIGINYLKGNESQYKVRYGGLSESQTGYIYNSAKMLQIKPSIVMNLGYSKWNPYIKTGMILGKGSTFTSQQGNFSGNIIRQQLISDGGLAIGFQAGLGINYAVAPKIKIFSEINFISLSYSPEKGNYTENFAYGRDFLNQSAYYNQVVYVDKLTDDPNYLDKPEERRKANNSFGSLGINIGVRYDFNL